MYYIRLVFTAIVFLASVTNALAQYIFQKNDTTPVYINANTTLQYPWAGGANFVQFSAIDLDFDNKKDLFMFDRTGQHISTFINTGAAGQVGYRYEPGLIYKFPEMQNWALLRDYDGDGREDIFTNYNGGVRVYRNISTPGAGVKFVMVQSALKSNYGVSVLGLFVSPADIPAIDDIDGDGDIDILTFSLLGSCMEYHQNQSVELYGVPDSLGNFKLKTDNWGLFRENVNNNSVTLNDSCDTVRVDLLELEGLELPYTHPEDGPGEPLRHQGSTETTFDLDSDGDKDLLLGDIAYTNIVQLTNGGNANFAQMSAFDLNYPSYNTSVNIELFPSTFMVDVNNDGKEDMLSSANVSLSGENFKGIAYYQNNGNGTQHTFSYIEKDFLQGDMIDVGEYALPCFFDYNNDGLMDLIVGNYGYYQSAAVYKGGLALFKNIGTPNRAVYKLITRDWCNLSAQNIYFMAPTFGDLDGDGKKDLVTGDRTGNIWLFKNIAATTDTCIFSAVPNAFAGIDVGGYATPQLYDLDKDGLLDLVVGEKNGNLNFFKNTGTTTAYQFATTPQNSDLGQIDIIDETFSNFGYSMPWVYDSAGVTHILVGAERGTVFHYTNIDGNLNGAFTLQDSVFARFDQLGMFAAPTAADINGDGWMDVAIGNQSGGVALYSGVDTLASSVYEQQFTAHNMFIYPNPANNLLNVTFSDVLPQQAYQISIVDVTGRMVFSQNYKGQKQVTLPLEIAPGLYAVVVTTNNGKATQKLVISQ